MQNLRQLREERGWSQVELARRLGVSQDVVSKWETGQVAPSGAKRYRLLVLFATPDPNDARQHSPPLPEEHYGGGETAGVG